MGLQGPLAPRSPFFPCPRKGSSSVPSPGAQFILTTQHPTGGPDLHHPCTHSGPPHPTPTPSETIRPNCFSGTFGALDPCSCLFVLCTAFLVLGKFSRRKTPKMATNRDFPGLRAFSANCARDKIEERAIPHPIVKSAAPFGAPKPSYGHFNHPAGHGRGKFLSRKTPKMAINRDFLGLRAFSANFARDKIEQCEIPHPIVKSAAPFGAPKPSYGHFNHPAGHGRGKVSSRRTPKMAINRDFPGLRAFSANFVRDEIEQREITHPIIKCAARLGAPKPTYGHFNHPAGHGRGSFQAERHQKWH